MNEKRITPSDVREAIKAKEHTEPVFVYPKADIMGPGISRSGFVQGGTCVMMNPLGKYLFYSFDLNYEGPSVSNSSNYSSQPTQNRPRKSDPRSNCRALRALARSENCPRCRSYNPAVLPGLQTLKANLRVRT